MLSVRHRGRGYGTEAQQAITQNVINALIQSKEFKRLNAEILVENEASWKLHEKCDWRSYEQEKSKGDEYYITPVIKCYN
jgi:RimJ/RimL family protein N-acetyltransferase